MNVLFELFFTFFKIGLFTFGGGYAMIPIVRDNVVAKGWMEETFFYELIGVCESTPGPIAINMATFVGSTVGGFWGSFFATLGVVLPSFIIIILVAALFRNFSDNPWVKAAFRGMRPVIFALIASTGIVLALKNVLSGFPSLFDGAGAFLFDWKLLLIMLIVLGIKIACKAAFKKKISPILLIVVSALCGMVMA